MSRQVLVLHPSKAVHALFKAAMACMPDMELFVATNGSEATDILWRLGRTDIIYLDIGMPLLEALELLAAYRPPEPPARLPIVIVTNQVLVAAVAHGLASITRAVA